MDTASFKQRVLNASIARILFGIIICFVAFVLVQQLTSKLFDVFPIAKSARNLIKGLLSSGAVLLAYRGFYGRYEQRAVNELSTSGWGKTVGAGLLLGAALQGLTMLVVAIFGSVQVAAVNPAASMVVPFAVAFSVAIFEEVLMRGILFRIAEEKLGSYLALAVTSLIFGLLHLANPGSTLFSGLCVVVAGVVFGLAYIYTRNLWFPIAIHFAWNFVQSGIFGAITSGNEKTSSWLTTKLQGSQLLTGGTFGPEASLQAVLLLLLAAAVLFQKSKPNLVKFGWRSHGRAGNTTISPPMHSPVVSPIVK